MTCKVGVWLDHKRAFIVTIRQRDIATTTVEREEVPMSRPGGGLRGAGGHQLHGVDPDGRRDQREVLYLNRYYEDVIKHLADAEAIHICGPGQAKVELKRRLLLHKPLAHRPVAVEAADRMTDAQIVARIREVFGAKPRRAAKA
jgi:hypothetical protein